MGYIRHHAIIVTSWDDKAVKKARKMAKDIFGNLVSNILHSNINSYDSFFISPDGSKEGWDESNVGDANRKTFIEWLNTQSYEDGSNRYSYAELFYGDDEGQSEIINHNRC